jgi:hypothetical protein
MGERVEQAMIGFCTVPQSFCTKNGIVMRQPMLTEFLKD